MIAARSACYVAPSSLNSRFACHKLAHAPALGSNRISSLVYYQPRAMAPKAGSASGPEKQQQPEAHANFTTPSLVLSIDPQEYRPQLDRKLERVQAMFSSLPPAGETMPEMEVFESAPINYRMRAEFSCWGLKQQEGKESDVHFIMYDSASGIKPPPMIRVDEFPVGSVLMNELMALVRQGVNKDPVLREKLFQVNFHTTQVGEAMVTLVYHKRLDDVWQEAAKKLRSLLAQAPSTHGRMPHVIGRSRKQKVELDQSHVVEQLTVNGKVYASKQVEATFSQPNAGMCQHMVSWAQTVTAGSHDPAAAAIAAAATNPTDTPGSADQGKALGSAEQAGTGDANSNALASSSGNHDLLELYCGNGNFTIPLAANFRRVVATEVSKSGVEAARWNIEANKVDNIFVARMSSEEFTDAWKTQATKRRLEGLDWAQLSLRTVLVDPPRAGLDPGTVKLVSEFERIVYISCNPETLLKNLKDLVPTHKLARFAAFDQFPYTHHLECGAYLVRREKQP